MSILFATPMYGGYAINEYYRSCMYLRQVLTLNGLEHEFLDTVNESLIQRARNTMATRFIRETKYQKLMFIDADIEFDAEDVAKLWNMQVPIATAAYPIKKPGKLTTAWVNGALAELSAFQGPTAIDYAGTGFMMIDRCVFEAIQKAEPWRKHYEGHVGECWAFFHPCLDGFRVETVREMLSSLSEKLNGRLDTSIGPLIEALNSMSEFDFFDHEEHGTQGGKGLPYFLSEDYAFCKLARNLGFEIMLEPSIRLGHVGRYVYRGE